MSYKIYKMIGNFSTEVAEFDNEIEAVDYITEYAVKDLEDDIGDDLQYMTEKDFRIEYQNAISYYSIDMD